MPKCGKVKNPCKICFEEVSKKKGLQCQGACRTWTHYSCLNYTPGKIKDIKAGIISVTCPCPDCTSISPREYRTDEPPYTCTYSGCPANQMPTYCESNTCPVNTFNKLIPSQSRVIPSQMGNVIRCGQICEDPCSEPEDTCCIPSKDVPGDFGRQAVPVISMSTLEEMCTTVGQLAEQINTLMTKIRDAGAKNCPGKSTPCCCADRR